MDESTAVQLVLPTTLALIMLSLGLSLQIADFKAVILRPKSMAVGLLGQLLVLPLLGLSTACLFSLSPAAAIGLVLLTGCPGGAHSNLFTELSCGDTALSISLTAVTSIATLLTLPLWVLLAATLFADTAGTVQLPLAETMKTLIGVVAAPTLLGMATRAAAPRLAAAVSRLLKGLAVCLLLMMVAGSVAKNGSLVLSHIRAVGAAVLALHLSALAAGLGLSWAARLSQRQALTIMLEVGVQNSAVAVGLALSLLSLEHAVPAIVYSLLVYATASGIILTGRHLTQTDGRDVNPATQQQ